MPYFVLKAESASHFRTYYADKAGIDPQNIVVVSVMPCTAKQFEARRPELGRHGMADVDAAVSYTHLDVYKRQVQRGPSDPAFPDRHAAGLPGFWCGGFAAAPGTLGLFVLPCVRSGLCSGCLAWAGRGNPHACLPAGLPLYACPCNYRHGGFLAILLLAAPPEIGQKVGAIVQMVGYSALSERPGASKKRVGLF